MLCEKYEMISGEWAAPLYTYILDSSEEIGIYARPMVLLCPGGAYRATSDREAEPVAMKLLAQGIHVGILRYSTAPARFPTALEQAAKSIALIRENAEKWHVDTNNICVMGFSAGGHLAASLGTFWNSGFLQDITGYSGEAIRPNALILCYPVITSGEYCHAGSFEFLLGDQSDDEKSRELVSLEKQVSAHTPKTFIWHTYEDDTVPVENSILFLSALRAKGIPCEAHIYPKGVHGLSLGTNLTASARSPGTMTAYPEICGWIDLLSRFIFQS